MFGFFSGAPGSRFAIAFLALAVLTAPERADPAPKATPSPGPKEDDPRVTLVLRAMNTSREHPSIDLEVTIDGEIAVRDRLSSQAPTDISIPPSKTFPLRLSRGNHVLRAASVEAKATLERTIEIRRKRWALLSYEPGDDGVYRFTLTVRDEPILFQ